MKAPVLKTPSPVAQAAAKASHQSQSRNAAACGRSPLCAQVQGAAMTNEPAVLSNTDPVAVGDESAALETEARSKLADAKGEFASRSEKVAGSWGAPEDVTV